MRRIFLLTLVVLTGILCGCGGHPYYCRRPHRPKPRVYWYHYEASKEAK